MCYTIYFVLGVCTHTTLIYKSSSPNNHRPYVYVHQVVIDSVSVARIPPEGPFKSPVEPPGRPSEGLGGQPEGSLRRGPETPRKAPVGPTASCGQRRAFIQQRAHLVMI